MPMDHLRSDTAPLTRDGKTVAHALWGDRIEVLGTDGALARVNARGLRDVRLDSRHLGGPALLELYFIDVGQGDGVLLRSPDGRHVLIDGGLRRSAQPTGKNAADFVDWKFVKDYGQERIELDALIASHNDADHYGGLADLLNPEELEGKGLDAKAISVEAIYHAGLSWWRQGTKGKTLGTRVEHEGSRYWTQLLGDRASAQAAAPELAGEWATFWQRALMARRRNGEPTPVRRLSQQTGLLPGFEGGPGMLAIHVLGPLETRVAGQPALRQFAGGDSINTNGQSVLLRLDYGHCRILLTGDLNRAAQTALLQAHGSQAFECDVAKACHHGSDDVSYRFLQALRAAVTVFSSGDNEGYDHPRPSILAASATTGFLSLSAEGDRIITPLLYATELARSTQLTDVVGVRTASDTPELSGSRLADVALRLKRPPRLRPVGRCKAVGGLVYGLVNVRTDGQRILCATRSEKDGSWDIKLLAARF